MAERTGDLICAKLGVNAPCLTRTEPLPASTRGEWTEPGLGPKRWIGERDKDDIILCECEMVSRKAVNQIIDGMDGQYGSSLLNSIGLRSRVGKGPCQGGFCGLRVTGHLYDEGYVTGLRGVHEMHAFTRRRWRGLRPVLWGLPLVQADLQEALYCGALDLELEADARDDGGDL
jgi:glycerol-3-phosphate dehydrogenase